MNIRVVRLTQDDIATMGYLLNAENVRLGVTLELPWKDNQHGVSCIPAGSYECHRAVHHPDSPKHYGVWRLQNVPNRDAVDIHVGNSVADTQGCILVGSAYAPDHRVVQSTAAFQRFMVFTQSVDRITLTISEAWCDAKPEQPA
jgi:hypothetical protein